MLLATPSVRFGWTVKASRLDHRPASRQKAAERRNCEEAMPAYDPNNIFGKILRGELPSHRVYEDDATIAIMDVMPTADGHTLVIPKAPSRNMLDADPAVLGRLVATTQKIAKAVKTAF